MADGTHKNIEDISVGDVVWSADPEAGTEGGEKVTAVHQASAETLSVSRGSDTIVTSPGHMFWDDFSSEWVDSSDLTPNDRLLTDRGTALTVAGGSIAAEERPVIDLTVSRNHTFFVSLGAENVLVHNCGSLAIQLGYIRTSYFSMGKPVYQRKTAPKSAPKYIVEDRTSHNGGYWKGASKPEYLASKTTRQGTYDANLRRIAD